MNNESNPYQSYVAARTRQNPNLSKFLTNDRSNRNSCRIACLEFSTSGVVSHKRLDLKDLASLLQSQAGEDKNLRGRLLVIEDLSSNIIEMLGCALNIDPFFFSSHIGVSQTDIAAARPYMATLPSMAKSQDFLTIQYHRVLQFEYHGSKETLLRDMNFPRKVRMLPPVKGANIGLAQHCCSILKTIGKDGLWLGKKSSTFI